jgi:glc operon protein GlcG
MLGHEEATLAIEAIRTELVRRSDAAVVAVSDAHGELVALLRIDGAPVSAVQVAINKAYTAARMRRSSRAIGEAIRDPARGIEASFYGDRRYVGWAGGLPVISDGGVIGAVGVSGMSQDLDEEMARVGVAAILDCDGTRTG